MKNPFNNMRISIVTPVYGCCGSLHSLYERLNQTLSTITESFEIIMISDSSPDDSWNDIKKLSLEDSRVRDLNLSRNFGKKLEKNSYGRYLMNMVKDI